VIWYKFHLGDYITHTTHLSDAEDLAYRRLLDLYYMSEKEEGEEDMKIWCNPGESVLEMIHRQAEKD